MKVVLSQALHARPASLLVRLATRHAAQVRLRKGSRTANARNILDVLALGAAMGEEIDVEAIGDDAENTLQAVVELVSHGFSTDLVPETGSAVVEGIAVGRAVLVLFEQPPPAERRSSGEELLRARAALARAQDELARLVEALPENEAALFEPERAIVRDATAHIEAEVAKGASAEEAVRDVLGAKTTDLIADARARLLDLLAGTDGATVSKVGDGATLDLVLVTDRLTPSLVATLPAGVRAIVAGHDAGEGGWQTSHAAILARGRDIPLALVPPHVASSIAEGDQIMVDTTASPARVWIGPSPQLVEAGRARHEATRGVREFDERDVGELESRLAVKICVNVSSLHERVPSAAHGVGLLRTELLFAARSRPPSEDEQYASLMAVARGAGGKMVTVRLFDAGGDKPLAWLSPSADEHGMALLFAHVDVLASQVRAILRTREREVVRILLPMCRSPADVQSIRALVSSLEVGAMIETPEAARDAAAIAHASDFVCIGTNDLAARLLGVGRAQAAHALDSRVIAAVDAVIGAAHAHGRRVTVCGEMAADPRGSRVLIGLGADALSVATSRFAEVVRSLSNTTRQECRATAEAALAETP